MESAAKSGGDGEKDDAVRRRKRNDLFGSIQSKLAQHRVAQPKRLSREWWRNASLGEREKALKKSYGFKMRDARFLATGSYSDVFGDRELNPKRIYPADVPPLAQRALDRLIKGKAMAQKKRKSKKKKNSMPAGLLKYWAKKRAKKSRRRAKRNPRPRVRVRTRTVIKYRTRTVKVYPKRKRSRRRRSSNPLRKAKRINLKGFTSTQIKRVASAIRSATGKRVRVVRP